MKNEIPITKVLTLTIQKKMCFFLIDLKGGYLVVVGGSQGNRRERVLALIFLICTFEIGRYFIKNPKKEKHKR